MGNGEAYGVRGHPAGDAVSRNERPFNAFPLALASSSGPHVSSMGTKATASSSANKVPREGWLWPEDSFGALHATESPKWAFLANGTSLKPSLTCYSLPLSRLYLALSGFPLRQPSTGPYLKENPILFRPPIWTGKSPSVRCR